jgi:energy-coupling factor transport system ATP-binding protein
MRPEINIKPNPNLAIIIDKLKIIYDENSFDELLVLDEFSYNFAKNKIYFIIGNSGSGKTTLVTHFNGLLKSKHGNLMIGSNPIYGHKRKIKNFKNLRREVGMVFQFPEYQLFKSTIAKDVMLGPLNLGVKKEEAIIRAKKYLNQMGLNDEFLLRSPFGLSGGQKRRVAIAGILAIEPNILIFDEPTAGLDPSGERETLNIIKDLKKQGKTIFVITHQMDQVLEIGDEVIVLDNKKIVASGTPYEIFTNQQLLSSTTLDIPKVIKVINELAKKNENFKKLYDFQPRNVEQLASEINKILDGVKHG